MKNPAKRFRIPRQSNKGLPLHVAIAHAENYLHSDHTTTFEGEEIDVKSVSIKSTTSGEYCVYVYYRKASQSDHEKSE